MAETATCRAIATDSEGPTTAPWWSADAGDAGTKHYRSRCEKRQQADSYSDSGYSDCESVATAAAPLHE